MGTEEDGIRHRTARSIFRRKIGIRPKYNAISCEKGKGGRKKKKERVGERMERKREMGGGGRLEKGRRRGGVRMRESEREREKITFHS